MPGAQYSATFSHFSPLSPPPRPRGSCHAALPGLEPHQAATACTSDPWPAWSSRGSRLATGFPALARPLIEPPLRARHPCVRLAETVPEVPPGSRYDLRSPSYGPISPRKGGNNASNGAWSSARPCPGPCPARGALRPAKGPRQAPWITSGGPGTTLRTVGSLVPALKHPSDGRYWLGTRGRRTARPWD